MSRMSRSALRVVLTGSLAVFLAFAPQKALAQRAAYANPDALPGEGVPHVLDNAVLGQYARVIDPDKLSGLANIGLFAVRTRALLGRTVAYAPGFDGEVGASNRGAVYGLTAYPVGVGARWGDDGTVSLLGGAGFDGMTGAVPVAARFPAELSAGLDVGPVRPVLWVRPSWVPGADARRHGSSISFVDELDAGLLVRLSRQHHYWGEMNAGGGLAIGVTYRELLGTRYLGFAVGFDFVGAQ